MGVAAAAFMVKKKHACGRPCAGRVPHPPLARACAASGSVQSGWRRCLMLPVISLASRLTLDEAVRPYTLLSQEGLAAELAAEGVRRPQDLVGLTTGEAMEVHRCLWDWSSSFVDQLLAQAALVARRERKRAVSPPVGPGSDLAGSGHVLAPAEGGRQRTPIPARAVRGAPGRTAAQEASLHALALLTAARVQREVPQPGALAEAVRRLQSLRDAPALFAEKGTPRQWAKLLAQDGITEDVRRRVQMVALWREFHSWKRSANQYASAVELYGQACSTAGLQPWPPCDLARDLMVAVCRRAGTLAYYLQCVRSVLHLLRAGIGVLADTKTLVLGARKAHRGAGEAPQVRGESYAAVAMARQTLRVRRASRHVRRRRTREPWRPCYRRLAKMRWRMISSYAGTYD